MEKRTAESVEILLILEGTFPYVRGGVSSWVKRIIEGFPTRRFGIIFLGGARSDYDRGKLYDLPENVDYFAEYFLYDESDKVSPRGVSVAALQLQTIRDAHEAMNACLKGAAFPMQYYDLATNFGVRKTEFLRSEAIWSYYLQCYSKIPDQPPFVNYFWTIRGMHAPLLHLQKALEAAPQIRLVLSPSTGYAGYLGALLADRQNRPLIISEHGVYTKERRIDLLMADWIEEGDDFLRRPGHIHHLRQLWIRFFEFLGRVSYQQAWRITNLYSGVIPLQIAGGATIEKLQTIPNGIRVSAYSSARRAFTERSDVVALIGRVVPIKDIKTFIRAASLLRQQGQTTEFWIVGPTEEDEEYYAECEVLVEHLGLRDSVQFLGFRSVVDILTQVRLTVLSSISEGLPLSVLESFAAGVPVVSTDVGACRELIYSINPNAEASSAGLIVPIADPPALAAAISTLLTNVEYWTRCSNNAVKRVESQYREEQMFERYRQLFDQALAD
jgi:glycosyltransferase involved in cell wall biosynthesis